jgi:hypothetical protein
MRITAELASPPLGYVINWRENTMEAELEKARLTIFEMEFFTQPQYQYFVTSFLVREYLKRLGTERRDQLQMLIVFEEAGRIFNAPFPQPQFNQVLRECREIGLGIMWINQSAEEVGNTAWANTNTLFVLKQISAKDINTVGSAVAFEKPREKTYCARLGVGEAIVRLPDRWRFPFLIRTEDFVKVPVTDNMVKETMAPVIARYPQPSYAGPGPIAIESDPFPPSGRGIKRTVKEEKKITESESGIEPGGGPVKEVEEVRQVDWESKLAGSQGLPEAQSLPELAGSQGGLGAPRGLGRPGGLSGQSALGARGEPGEQSGPGRPESGAFRQPTNQFASKSQEYEACKAHLLAKVAGEPGKPVTYVYSELGLSKAKGTKIKKMLLEAGLASEHRTSENGRVEIRLVPTAEGCSWLGVHASLLARPLTKWDTNRFGGEKSKELERVFLEYAERISKPVKVEKEADDLAGGKHDLLLTLEDGSQIATELISGESKAGEIRHIIAAMNGGRRYIGLCYDDGIRDRVRKYLSSEGLIESSNLKLLVPNELA